MRYIYNPYTEPTLNLALEEWLLRHGSDDIFMLWRNAAAIIVGRNQNTLAEINEDFVRERGISVIRRLTGGGAVFHDLGNVNFTFIQHGYAQKGLDFQRFTNPILAALQAMGVDCTFEGRNDLVIKGQKFSGNAQRVEKDRVLHHGTLLFAAHMPDISGALRVHPAKYADKAVKSVRARVTNISSHLPEPMDVETFMQRIMQSVSGGSLGDAQLREEEIAGARQLVRERYGRWDWNFGASPQYGFSRALRTPGGMVEAHVDVRQGRIAAIRLHGDYFGIRPVAELEALLVGCMHEREALARVLGSQQLDAFMHGVDLHSLLSCLV
ncbi:lipoate--protein ligase [Desulfovibrionales bacterium]